MSYKYILDSCAWAEFFDGTDKGQRVKDILQEGNSGTSIIALAEFSDKCARENRNADHFVRFIQAKSAILPLTAEIALKAGPLKVELRKVSKNISLADCIHLQTARSQGAVFVTGDPDFRNIEGVMFLD